MKIAVKLFTLCLLILFGTIRAMNYTVTNAQDIEDAMENAQPGDSLIMTNGLWSDQWIIFQGQGTVDQPIVLKAETPGKVILSGISILRISGEYLVVDGLKFIGGYSRSGGVIEFRNGSSRPAHHCRLTNSAIIDYNPSTKNYGYKWVSIYGTYNRVDHCYFEGKNHEGATLVVWLDGEPNYHLIDRNYFGHRPELGMNGGETIRVGTSTWSLSDSYTTVEYNYFEKCDGETEIISSKSCENIYRYNTFYNCRGVLTLRHGNRCTVEGNFFFGNKNYQAGGVRIIGEDHEVYNNYFYQLYGGGYRSALCMVLGVPDSPLNRYFQVKRALVAFNTFVDCRNTFLIGHGNSNDQSLPPVDCTIANNIAVSDRYDLIEYEVDPVNLQYESNIMFGDPGISPPEGIDNIDPEFVMGEDSLWRLPAQSPAVNMAAGNYDFIIHDMDGQPRIGAKDIGADEYSDAPIVRGPVGPEQTGPAWLGTVSAPLILAVQTLGEGTVSIDPPGGVYDKNTMITLHAVPDSGWEFVHWEGDVSGSENPLSITMDDNKTIRAVFENTGPDTYELVTYVFSGGGTVHTEPEGTSFLEGTWVTLTAVPEEGWTFKEWSGDLTGSANPDSILIDSDKSVLATFEKNSLVSDVTSPQEFTLSQNYPNPFNPSTRIAYSLPRPTYVSLVVYNKLGQKVATLTEKFQPAGIYHVVWNGLADDGTLLNSGVYFYRLYADGFSQTRKMVIMH